MHNQYKKLIQSFCSLVGLENPEQLIHNGSIVLNEVRFSFVYMEAIRPEVCFVYCDFGEPLPEKITEIYRSLLEINVYLHSSEGPIFTLSPENGRVTLSATYPLETISPQALLDSLKNMAQNAREWRQHYFLGENHPLSGRDNNEVGATFMKI